MNFEQNGYKQTENGEADKNAKYELVLAELENVLSKSEEEKLRYIEDRIKKMSDGAPKGEISLVGNSIHHGFLGPDMHVRRNFMVDPICVDDVELYKTFFETVRMFKNADGWKDQSLRAIVPMAIQWTLSSYFGNYTSSGNTEMKNREFYIEHTSSDSSVISIKEFKGKGFAVCTEKASAGQNLLAFAGLDSTLVASGKCRIPAEANESGHYFVVIHGPTNEMIFDPTNPRCILNSDNTLLSIGPSMYKITKEQSEQVLSGQEVIVEHVDNKTDENGNKIEIKTKRVYVGPKKS